MKRFLRNLKYDLPTGIVVFFIALPLCLGIALASDAPLFAGIVSGIIGGIIGGIIVGILSGSPLGVSGPAAGLATIVSAYVISLSGSWESFLLVVVISGIIQLILGFLRLGTIAYYFPSSVIKGMLAGIGILIIIKQIPHALGYDTNFVQDFGMDTVEENGINSLSHISQYFSLFSTGSIVISVSSLILMIVWDRFLTKKHKFFRTIPSPLAVVALGIILFNLLSSNILPFSLSQNHVVNIPVSESFSEFFGQFKTPNFSQISNPNIYLMAFVIAIVASLETLLSVEACDKLDKLRGRCKSNFFINLRSKVFASQKSKSFCWNFLVF